MIKTIIMTAAVLTLTACATTANRTKMDNKKTFVVGAYSEQHALTEQEAALFKQVTAELDGVNYTPESVSRQVVAGTNYRFICKAAPVVKDPKEYQAEVTVFAPLPGQGEPRITSIRKL